MTKTYIRSLILVSMLLLAACAPSASQVQTAVAQTQAAWTPTITHTIQPTETLTVTYTPQPTETPLPSLTPTLKATLVPTSTPLPKLGSRTKPFPFGTEVSLVKGGDQFITLTVSDVTRGDDAWVKIHGFNMFNPKAPDGQEYVLFMVSVDYTSGPQDSVFKLSRFDFGILSDNNILDKFITVVVNPEFTANLFPGGHYDGYIANLVYADDPTPLLYLGDPSGSGQNVAVYFSLF
jgi:hypothetical protein